MMINSVFKIAIFTLVILNFAESQNDNSSPVSNISNQSSSVNATSRFKEFAIAFANAVQNSPQLTQVFSVSVPPFEASVNLYKSLQSALKKGGVQYPEFVAKNVADALYITISSMNEKIFTYAIADSMALYLISQDAITLKTAASLANKLADYIINNYSENGSSESAAYALSFGAINFLSDLGAFKQKRATKYPLSIAKQLYSVTTISEPILEISVIAPPRTVPSAFDVYGITAYALTFLRAVDSSSSLRSVFYTRKDSKTLSEAWGAAATLYCSSINCANPVGSTDRLQGAVSLTHDSISKSKYVTAIANGYSLTMLGMGTLTASSAESDAKTLSETMIKLFDNLPSDADLKTKLGVIFDALTSLVGSDSNIVNQYSAFNYQLRTEFYAATSVERPTLY